MFGGFLFMAGLSTASRSGTLLSPVLLICLLGPFARPLMAQQIEPASYEGFEGTTVSKVDVADTPVAETASLRSLIKQQAGQPFSIATIRESVAALQQTKLFSQVQVSIQPEQSGLRVVFIPQPAYYVGMLSFPGATTAFPYTRLLQAVNIPDESPFVESLPTDSSVALVQFFKTAGFFAASVHAEAQPDKGAQIVNIVFNCALNKRAKIGQLSFEGLSTEQATDVRRALKSFWARAKGASLKPGQNYSRTRLNKSVDYMRGHFQKSGYLTPIVQLTSSSYQPETNRADITFEVHPGPLVAIRVRGARVSKRTLKRLIPIYDVNAVDQGLVTEGQRNLSSYFQSKGYFDVRVDSHLDQTADSANVAYDINRGSRHRVEGVHFEGNRYFSDRELQTHILIKKEHFPVFFFHGTFSEDRLRRSVNSLTALYRNEGFAKASIQPKVVDHEPELEVTFLVSEGEQNKVNSLRIVNSSNQAISPPIDKPLNIAPGKPYSPHRLEDDRNQIMAQYLNNGYLNARFQSKASPIAENPNLLDVVFTIDPGPQAHISQVALLGAQTTRPKFIRTITDPNFKEGQPLSEGKLLAAESDLYNVGVFDWASISPRRPVTDQDQNEVLVKVHESKRNTLDVGGGIEVLPRSGNIPVGTVALPGVPPVGLGGKFSASQKSYFGPRITFQFARHNIRGRAETAAFGVVFSRLDQRAALTYTDPHLRGWTWSSLLSASVERSTENPIFAADLGRGSWQIERGLDLRRTKILRFRYSFQKTVLKNITVPDLVLPEDRKVRLSTFSTEYIRDTRDKPLDAHHGLYQVFTFGVTPSAIGSSSDFVRFLGQNAFYLPVKLWLTWANNVRFGVAAPFSGSHVPLSERFFSGGADSLRGFPINGAGPQRPVTVCSDPANLSTCTLVSVPVGGNMLAILNSEARFPIPIKSGLGGVVFYDGGNVFSRISLAQFINNYSNSIGFGLRYQTPVGPVRFDIGRNLSPIPGVRATQYFVTLGQAF
jgi:outer membrane protein assembly factor BamA